MVHFIISNHVVCFVSLYPLMVRGTVQPSIPAALIMSSEVSCVQALKGGFIVNSWKVDAVGDAMAAALRADDSKRIAWHEVCAL